MVKNMMFTPAHIQKRGKSWQELETARLWRLETMCLMRWDSRARTVTALQSGQRSPYSDCTTVRAAQPIQW